jgi:ABC-type glycerol-3-phosphate transport system substrate-binding protein
VAGEKGETVMPRISTRLTALGAALASVRGSTTASERHARAKTIVVAVLALVTSSMASGSSVATAAEEATLEPATIELWATNAGDIHSKAIQDSAARFEAAHPGVNVDVVIVPAPYPDKVAVAMAGGNPPQIFAGFGGGTLKAQVEAGQVYSLDDALDEYPGWFDRFFPGVMTNAVVDGKTYAIPMNGIQPVVLFYNEPLFEQFDLQPPATWDELLAAVETFKANDIIPIAVAGVRTDAWTELMWLEYLVDRVGGPEPFNRAVAGEPDAWSDPAFLSAAQMIRQLVDAGAFGDNFASASYVNGQTDALVSTNRAAMQLQGTWDYDIMKAAAPDFVEAGNYGFTAFPTVPGGTGDARNLQGNPANFYSISNNTTPEQLAAALAYLHDEVSSDQYVEDFIGIGYVPPVEGVEENLATGSSNPELATFIYEAAQAAPSFTLSWDQALAPDAAQALLNNLNDLFNGDVTPEDFVEAMNETL